MKIANAYEVGYYYCFIVWETALLVFRLKFLYSNSIGHTLGDGINILFFIVLHKYVSGVDMFVSFQSRF